jgi:drug/metabolite transporter (DMT)-like permease
MSRASREIAGMLLSCSGGAALLMGLASSLATSTLFRALMAGTILLAVMLVISLHRDQVGLGRALLAAVLIGGITFGLAYGLMCYLVAYVPPANAEVLQMGP